MVNADQRVLICPAAAVLCCCLRREYPDLAEEGSSSSSSGAAQPKFKLALHCGGCMIDAQKMRARIADMEDAGTGLLHFSLLCCSV